MLFLKMTFDKLVQRKNVALQGTFFVTLVYEKIELEKYIAITTNKLLFLNKKMVQFSKHLIINYINQ